MQDHVDVRVSLPSPGMRGLRGLRVFPVCFTLALRALALVTQPERFA
jgi:hypothetical protein